jgi:ABC-type sugar transport system ATPase subunit
MPEVQVRTAAGDRGAAGDVTAGATPEVAALEVTGLSKTFGGFPALSDVSLRVGSGEVHALLGQNGSGKSTLIKCLAGVHHADHGGTVSVFGKVLPHNYPPSAAHKYGLTFVHQDLGLLGNLTVAENLALGTGFAKRGPLVSWRRQNRLAADVLDDFHLAVRATDLVSDLSATQRTLLAVARAITAVTSEGDLGCLVLDEPTAALPDADAEILFSALRKVARRGHGIVYVTHRLNEVSALTSKVTVLRDGMHVGTYDTADLTHNDLVEKIAGTAVGPPQRSTRRHRVVVSVSEPPVLVVENLCGIRVQDVSFELSRGEILGVAGLAGSGRSELARLVTGAQRRTSGTISVAGRQSPMRSPAHAKSEGVVLTPEDRRMHGCVLAMSSGENLTLPTLDTLSRGGLLRIRHERRFVQNALRRYLVRPPDPDRQMSTLSGGNQQKVVLAKWMSVDPSVLVLDEPLQGVDVSAKHEVHELLTAAAENGLAIVVVDSEFKNLVDLCDRVLVLRNGRVTVELSGSELHERSIVQSVFGVGSEVSNEPTAPSPGESM